MRGKFRLPVTSVLLAITALQACGGSQPKSSLKDEVNPIGSDSAIKAIIHAPESRVLPDFSRLTPNITVWCINGPTCDNSAQMLIDARTSSIDPKGTQAEQAPLSAQSRYIVSLDYQDSTNYPQYRVLIADGRVSSSTEEIEISLQRIDVNHMHITRPDGSSYTSPGKAQIFYSKTGDSYYSLGTIDTGTGIDVLNGAIYKIIVAAKGEDGMKTSTSFLDFRH